MASYKSSIREDIWIRWEAIAFARNPARLYEHLPVAFERFAELNALYLESELERQLSADELQLILMEKWGLEAEKSEWQSSLLTAHRLLQDSRFAELTDNAKANVYYYCGESYIQLGMWPQVWDNLCILSKLDRHYVKMRALDLAANAPAHEPAPLELCEVSQDMLSKRKSYVRLAKKIVPGTTTNAELIDILNQTSKSQDRRTHAQWNDIG
ncbi:MAG: hypothetical protein K8R88_15430 [Armatimonadetes bacterium]|nr:hypothetical protein [Armatimonadota bacterium]